MLVFKARRKNPTAGPQLTASQRRIMKIMADAMEEVRRQVIRDEPKILDVLLHGPDSRIPSLVSNDPWWKAQRLIADELFAELIAAGRRTGSSFPKIQKATVSYRFDAERPDAAAWAEKEAGNLIVEVTQGQVDMVRDYVSRSQMGEFTVPQVARNLRDVVGLTSQQSGWVDNYRSRFISDRLAAGDTLEQAMRAAAGPTERYQKRIHKYRTETIARTEILRAANEGRNQAWQQGIEEGYISPAAQKQWATEPDACEICIPLDGESVPITGEFPDGDPPLHPNCRCDVLMVDVDVSDYENMTWDEIDAELDQLLTDSDALSIGNDQTTFIPSGADTQTMRSAAIYPEDEINALHDEASRLRREANQSVIDSGGEPVTWRGPDPEKYPREAAMYEQADTLQAEALQTNRDFYDESFTTRSGINAGNDFGSFTPEGKKWRDKYVTDDDGTLSMNRGLRSGRKPTARAQGIDEMIAEHQVTRPVQVYRGAILEDEVTSTFSPGSIFSDRGFQSTDVSSAGARRYAEDRAASGAQGRPVLFEVGIDSSTRAAYVGNGEIVIGRDASMEILGSREEDGWLIVEVLARHV